MLGAFKKFILNNTECEKSCNISDNVHVLDPMLQKKYSKGIHYNLKIIIKGDRNVGKSCLFSRLQGKSFFENYEPTSEIKIANINWNYKNTDNVVKVEIWDVVDKGTKVSPQKQVNNQLKFENEQFQDVPFSTLDSQLIDVYKNTHGIILMLDITKKWTLDYVKKELEKINIAVPILILANKRDLQHKRVIDLDEIIFAVNECENNSKLLASTHIKIIESSMKNNFGLKYIHKFFNLPFLELQRDTLIYQLAINSENIQLTLEELKYHAQSFEQNYDSYLDQINNYIKTPANQNIDSPNNNTSPINDNREYSLQKNGVTPCDEADKTSFYNNGRIIDKRYQEENANKNGENFTQQPCKSSDGSNNNPQGHHHTPNSQFSPAVEVLTLKGDSEKSSILSNTTNIIIDKSPGNSITIPTNSIMFNNDTTQQKPPFDTGGGGGGETKSSAVMVEDKLANFVPRGHIDYSFFESSSYPSSNNKTTTTMIGPPQQTNFTETSVFVKAEDLVNSQGSNFSITNSFNDKPSPSQQSGDFQNLNEPLSSSSDEDENENSINPMVIIYPEDLDS